MPRTFPINSISITRSCQHLYYLCYLWQYNRQNLYSSLLENFWVLTMDSLYGHKHPKGDGYECE